MDILNVRIKHSIILGALAATFALWPTSIHHPRFILFQKKLTIQTSKLDPPRVAFDEIYNSQSVKLTDWDLLNKKDGTLLNTDDGRRKFASKASAKNFANRQVTLQIMQFSHSEITETGWQPALSSTAEMADVDLHWEQKLAPRQRMRLETAQQKYGNLTADWEENLSPSKHSLPAQRVFVEKTATPVAGKQAIVTTGPYKISGSIEYSHGAGLPSGDPWKIEVSRYQDDVQKEVAQIDNKKNTYEIQVPDASGTLLAHLVNSKTGQVLGEGTYRLSAYSANQFAGNAKIVIGKSPDYVATNFAAFSSTANPKPGIVNQKPVAARVLMASLGIEGKTDESGTYRFDQIKKGSWSLLRTEAKGFQPSLSLLQSGSEKKQNLFPETMIDSLKKVIHDQARSSQVAETGSIVFGQVIQNGRPIPGAQVQVESLQNHHAVYFNSLLFPDPELKATSENGYFAFVDLPSGFHSLIALHGNAYLSHSNVVVDDDAVSSTELESSMQTEKVEVKVFDAFTGSPERANIEMQSLPAPLTVQGFAQVHMPAIPRLSLARVHPENRNFLDCLQVYDDSQDSVAIPLISQAWLDALMAERKITLRPETGVVLGFSQNAHFEVYLGQQQEAAVESTIYFDAHGNFANQGVPGGGFVIFNVPQGVQSIVWANRHSDLLQTQVIPMDASGLAVLKFR